MIWPRTTKLIGRMVLKSRWSLSQMSRSLWLLVLKSSITWQSLGLGPLEGMLVLTSRWHQGQKSWSRSPWSFVLKSLITWQYLGLGPSNLGGMLVLTSRWYRGQRSSSQWQVIAAMLGARALKHSMDVSYDQKVTLWAGVLVKVSMTFRTTSLLQCYV